MTEKDFQQFVVEHLVKLTEGQEELRQNIVRMEFQLTEKIDALFDAQAATNEKLDEHSAILAAHTEHLQRIENKIEGHDIQIQILDKTKSNKRNVK